MKRRLATAAVAVGIGGASILVGAAPASAAAPGRVYSSGNIFGPVLHIDAGAATDNRISFYTEGNRFLVKDDTATLNLDGWPNNGGCNRVSDRILSCPTNIASLDVKLGDGADTFTNSTAVKSTVDGGAGRDTIHGGSGDDTIEGGPDYDRVYGEGGADTLNSAYFDDDIWGGNGGDTISTSLHIRAGDGNDTLLMVQNRNQGDYYGDGGVDTVTYADWTWDVWVSLDGNANDGTWASACDDKWTPWPLPGSCPVPNGTHNIHGDWEKIIGSANNDVIKGNDNANEFYGMGGHDRLFGSGGNDILDAGPTSDGYRQRTEGGTGTDTCRGDNLVSPPPGCDN